MPHPLKVTIPALLMLALGASYFNVRVPIIPWLILYVGGLSVVLLLRKPAE